MKNVMVLCLLVCLYWAQESNAQLDAFVDNAGEDGTPDGTLGGLLGALGDVVTGLTGSLSHRDNLDDLDLISPPQPISPIKCKDVKNLVPLPQHLCSAIGSNLICTVQCILAGALTTGICLPGGTCCCKEL